MPARTMRGVRRLIPRVPPPPSPTATLPPPDRAGDETGSLPGAIVCGVIVFAVCVGLRSASGVQSATILLSSWTTLCLAGGLILAGVATTALSPGRRKWVGAVIVAVLGGGLVACWFVLSVLWVLGGGPGSGSGSGLGCLFRAAVYGVPLGLGAALLGHLGHSRGHGVVAATVPAGLVIAALVLAFPLGRAHTVRQGEQAARLLNEFLPKVLADPDRVEVTEVSWWDMLTPRLSVSAKTAQPPATISWSIDGTATPRDMHEALQWSYLGLVISLPTSQQGWAALSAQSLTAAGLNPHLLPLLRGPDPRIFRPGIYLEAAESGITYKVSAPGDGYRDIRIRCDAGGP